MFLHKITALAIVACLAVADAAANSTCYFPNGEDSGGGVCNANADVSVCCGATYVRTRRKGRDTNSTALAVPIRHSTPHRALSSVQNVSSPDRFFVAFTDSCVAPFPSDNGKGVKSCGNNKYCCGRADDCCTNEANIFTLPEGEVVKTVPIPQVVWRQQNTAMLWQWGWVLVSVWEVFSSWLSVSSTC
jgi:hypothetical protein